MSFFLKVERFSKANTKYELTENIKEVKYNFFTGFVYKVYNKISQWFFNSKSISQQNLTVCLENAKRNINQDAFTFPYLNLKAFKNDIKNLRKTENFGGYLSKPKWFAEKKMLDDVSIAVARKAVPIIQEKINLANSTFSADDVREYLEFQDFYNVDDKTNYLNHAMKYLDLQSIINSNNFNDFDESLKCKVLFYQSIWFIHEQYNNGNLGNNIFEGGIRYLKMNLKSSNTNLIMETIKDLDLKKTELFVAKIIIKFLMQTVQENILYGPESYSYDLLINILKHCNDDAVRKQLLENVHELRNKKGMFLDKEDFASLAINFSNKCITVDEKINVLKMAKAHYVHRKHYKQVAEIDSMVYLLTKDGNLLKEINKNIMFAHFPDSRVRFTKNVPDFIQMYQEAGGNIKNIKDFNFYYDAPDTRCYITNMKVSSISLSKHVKSALNHAIQLNK